MTGPWWLMVWPDGNARSVHNHDPKHKLRDAMKVVKVVPAYQLAVAVEALRVIALEGTPQGVEAAKALAALGEGDPLVTRHFAEGTADA
jgi:hypothetical protein